MPTPRELKRRIDSVTNTRQITSAMRMVSAVKLNRAQMRAQQAQPYAYELSKTLAWLAEQADAGHAFFESNQNQHVSLIILTSDRGLAGAFNSQLNKEVLGFLQQQPACALYVFGRKGQEFFRMRLSGDHKLEHSIVQQPEVERFSQMDALMEELAQAFLRGETGQLWLAHNRFYNPIKQTPVLTQLLPVAALAAETAEADSTTPTTTAGSTATTPPAELPQQILLEPSPRVLLERLLTDYLHNQAYTALLETEAGEHGARMVAMEAATKNAGEMIDSLTLQYNRLRQSMITRELIEIINGAQALG